MKHTSLALVGLILLSSSLHALETNGGNAHLGPVPAVTTGPDQPMTASQQADAYIAANVATIPAYNVQGTAFTPTVGQTTSDPGTSTNGSPGATGLKLVPGVSTGSVGVR